MLSGADSHGRFTQSCEKEGQGHQLSSAPGPPHVVLAVRWDRLITSAPARPSQSRAAEVESPPRESDPDPRYRGAGPAGTSRPPGRPAIRLRLPALRDPDDRLA